MHTLLFCLAALTVLARQTDLFAQTQSDLPNPGTGAFADTTLLEWSEASAYQIAQLRVQRWLLRKHLQAETSTYLNVVEILREAGSFAKEADYITAQMLLETALELIATDSKASAPPQTSTQSWTPLSYSSSKPAWRWQHEALLGIDLSRLEYELGNEDLELLYANLERRSVQDNANPFAGARFHVSRSGGTAWDLRAFSLLKTSREYHNGLLEFAAQNALGQETNWRAENRFEATSYRDTSGLRYWQNTSLLQGGVKLGKHVTVEVGDEFRVRRYGAEKEFSPNYLHNEIGMRAVYSAGVATRLEARYQYGARAHPRFSREDYLEHRIEASVSQHALESSAIFVQNIWRRRVYPLGVPDSTFQNTYQEEFLRADLTIGFTERAGLRLEGDLTLRQYEIPSVYTPDFLNARINPKLQFKIWKDWQASFGYIFLLQVNSTKQAASADDPQLSFVHDFYEDYYANGFTLGLDLLSTSGFLMSASHVFEARIYPDSPVGDATAFNPNPNHNSNSFLLFLSWQINPRWQLSAIANFDSQISRSEYSEDLRNTIFSLETGYAF
ncbi:hypothetical protein HUU05_10735 [candidate division KSB1 bacterium]|nr:hypothetical protein [candidate division KSB1 bacterium]